MLHGLPPCCCSAAGPAAPASPALQREPPRPPPWLPQARSGSGAAALPEPTEAELEELYQAVDFHPEEQQAAAAGGHAGGGGGAAGLHLTLDCLLSKASLLLLDGSGGAGAAGESQNAGSPGGGGGQGAGGGAIASLELHQLNLQAQVQPAQVAASLTLAEVALHDLCSEGPGLSSQLLTRGAASAAPAAAAPAARSPVLRLHLTSAAGGEGGHGEQAERRPQLDVLVQPLRLRLRPLCLQRLLGLVPPVVEVGGAWSCVWGWGGAEGASLHVACAAFVDGTGRACLA